MHWALEAGFSGVEGTKVDISPMSLGLWPKATWNGVIFLEESIVLFSVV